MNWYKAKTILIIFFLCTNIFLLVNILNAADKSTAIPDAVVSSAVDVLAQNGIAIDPDLIPRRNQAAAVIHAENVARDYDAFAGLLLGGNIQKAEDNTYTSPAGTLSFAGDSFSFTAGDVPLSNASPAKAAEDFLKELGLDLSGSRRTVSGGQVVYKKSFAGSPFFNGSLTLQIENGGVRTMQGCWFQEKRQGLFREKSALKSAASILVDFASQGSGAARVTGLEFGYTLPDTHTLHPETELVPTWMITTDSGEQIFMDARENDT